MIGSTVRSVLRWIRVVLPPWWALLLFLLVDLFWEGLWCVTVRQQQPPEVGAPLLDFRDRLVGMACGLYGVFRVLAFHPAFRPAYYGWLRLTPWTSRHPLPLGPVRLVPQDAVLLAIVLFSLHDSPTRLLLVPLAFLVPYLIVTCYSMWLTGQNGVGYGLAFGLGLLLPAAGNLPATWILLGLLYLLAWFGLRRSLAGFPWQGQPRFEQFRTAQGKSRQPTDASRFGGLLAPLRASLPERPLSYRDGVLISLLIGWWSYALSVLVGRADPAGAVEMSMAAHVSISAVVIVARSLKYCFCYRPPISLWGRIRTLRWIIPGYDQVLVAPLLAAIIGLAAPWTFWMIGLSPQVVFPLSTTLVLLAALNLGPTLNHWRLTGTHRIVPRLAI